MHQCPKCSSQDIHRSRAKSQWESWRKELTGKRPYRCRACGWRGWGADSGPKFGSRDAELGKRASAPEPPNLKGTGLAREAGAPDLDLKQLDPAEPGSEESR